MWGRVTTVQGGVQLNYDLNEASESERDDESSTQSLSLGVPCYDTGAGENQLGLGESRIDLDSACSQCKVSVQGARAGAGVVTVER